MRYPAAACCFTAQQFCVHTVLYCPPSLPFIPHASYSTFPAKTSIGFAGNQKNWPLALNSAGKWSSRTGSEEQELEAGMSDPCYPLSCSFNGRCSTVVDFFFGQNMPFNQLSADPAPWPVSVVNTHSHLARKVQTVRIHGCIMEETVKLSIKMHCCQGYVCLCSYFMYFFFFF